MRPLKTDVEQGSMLTAIGHGLADPKKLYHYYQLQLFMLLVRKGNELKFSCLDVDLRWQHTRTRERR